MENRNDEPLMRETIPLLLAVLGTLFVAAGLKYHLDSIAVAGVALLTPITDRLFREGWRVLSNPWRKRRLTARLAKLNARAAEIAAEIVRLNEHMETLPRSSQPWEMHPTPWEMRRDRRDELLAMLRKLQREIDALSKELGVEPQNYLELLAPRIRSEAPVESKRDKLARLREEAEKLREEADKLEEEILAEEQEAASGPHRKAAGVSGRD